MSSFVLVAAIPFWGKFLIGIGIVIGFLALLVLWFRFGREYARRLEDKRAQRVRHRIGQNQGEYDRITDKWNSIKIMEPCPHCGRSFDAMGAYLCTDLQRNAPRHLTCTHCQGVVLVERPRDRLIQHHGLKLKWHAGFEIYEPV